MSTGEMFLEQVSYTDFVVTCWKDRTQYRVRIGDGCAEVWKGNDSWELIYSADQGELKPTADDVFSLILLATSKGRKRR